jgi:23S rRNA (pseudouridine1915-N3)-methyltransferase
MATGCSSKLWSIYQQTRRKLTSVPFFVIMKIILLVIGKTTPSWLEEGCRQYAERLIHYAPFSVEVIPDVKRAPSVTNDQLKELEADAFLKRIQPRDRIILLDEKGKGTTSEGLADSLSRMMASGAGRVVFIIGGAFGHGKALADKAAMTLSLSELTFSHQMVRLIFLEQLYRAFTIIRGEPYHHR